MLKVLNCIASDHDYRLVVISALICVVGCFTTTTLMARAAQNPPAWSVHIPALTALVFGCSVWSMHFVAMLAFRPGLDVSYDVDRTGLSAVVATLGSLVALMIRRAGLPRSAQVSLAGLVLGLAVSGMHYVGVAAMDFSGFLLFDRGEVVWSIAVSIAFSSLAFARADELTTNRRRCEVAGWLSLAICGLHFTGMSAITIAPGPAEATGGQGLDAATLAFAVGGVTLAILLACLAATMVEQHLSQRALRDLDRMRRLSNLAREVLIIQRDGTVLEMNDAGERLFKTDVAELIGRPLLSLFTEDSAPALLRRARCSPFDRPPEEFTIRTLDGRAVEVELSCQPIDHLGRPATAVALRDLTDSKRDEARIRHLARHDALTNLPNRYNLQERLDAAARMGDRLAVLFLDLDRFKSINDLHGHAVGDALLVQVAKRILAELQPMDTLARIGGDEFVLVSSDACPERVSNMAIRIVEALRRPFMIEGKRLEVGVSIGIALYPDDGGDAETLLRAADAALYKVKKDGRGALRFYEAAMNSQLKVRLELGQDLTGALERDELILHYQPLVNGITGEVETYEALIRWLHPTRGTISPAVFIPLAEQSGLILPIGQWVIETACREAAGWGGPWRVSINVSPMQFRQVDICELIARTLDACGLPPARLVVEVTESILIADADKAVATLKRLREVGIRVALDDFGTGYSSLSYLQRFRFDKLKIDKSFVSKLGQSEDALTLTRTIVNLAHNLGLQVTAEGVETPTQLAILKSLGCDQIQGYLVARPAVFGSYTDVDRLRTAALFGQAHTRLSA